MIRATISFKGEGWLTDLAELPRIGDEIVLRDHEGETLRRGRVSDVRHLIFGDVRGYRAGSSQVEVDVSMHPDRTSSAARWRRRVDDVLLVVALIPLAPVIFLFWLAMRKVDYDLFI